MPEGVLHTVRKTHIFFALYFQFYKMKDQKIN